MGLGFWDEGYDPVYDEMQRDRWVNPPAPKDKPDPQDIDPDAPKWRPPAQGSADTRADRPASKDAR
jgi:hypothetical protein